MKKPILFLSTIFIVSFISSCGGGHEEQNNSTGNDSLQGKISMSGAFALYPMAVKWSEEYHKLFPHVTFDIQAGGAGKGLTDALSGTVDAGMVSRAISPEETARGAWPLSVAKDAVVATVSNKNPYINEIMKRGITREQFRKIWIEGSITTWGQLLGNSAKEKIQVFTRSDAAGAPETWANYLGGRQENLKGVGVFGDPGVAEAVVKDNLAIGFNNVNYVYDGKTGKPFEGLQSIPIDLNGNNSLDAEENFYADIEQLNKAIIDGRYTSPPARELYFVFKSKPANHSLVKFLKWVLADGQQYVAPSGYVKLSDNILQRELEKLK